MEAVSPKDLREAAEALENEIVKFEAVNLRAVAVRRELIDARDSRLQAERRLRDLAERYVARLPGLTEEEERLIDQGDLARHEREPSQVYPFLTPADDGALSRAAKFGLEPEPAHVGDPVLHRRQDGEPSGAAAAEEPKSEAAPAADPVPAEEVEQDSGDLGGKPVQPDMAEARPALTPVAGANTATAVPVKQTAKAHKGVTVDVIRKNIIGPTGEWKASSLLVCKAVQFLSDFNLYGFDRIKAAAGYSTAGNCAEGLKHASAELKKIGITLTITPGIGAKISV